MTTPLALATNRRDDGTYVLSAVGELDLSNVDSFTQALDAAIDAAPGADAAVTIDLSDIEYLDSSAKPAQSPATIGRLALRAIISPATRERLRRALGRDTTVLLK